MEKEYVNGEKAQMAQIWISVPKRHDKVIFCAVVAGVILLLTILLIRGNGLCVAAGILMAFLAIGVHFLMQKRITIANLIFYFDRGEIYLVSLHKEDRDLRAYLFGQMEEPLLLSEEPGAHLMKLADKSVIWHIQNISSITEFRSRPNNKRYKIYFSFDLPGYEYDSVLEIMIQQKHFERFESLMDTLHYINKSQVL